MITGNLLSVGCVSFGLDLGKEEIFQQEKLLKAKRHHLGNDVPLHFDLDEKRIDKAKNALSQNEFSEDDRKIFNTLASYDYEVYLNSKLFSSVQTTLTTR